MHQQIFVTFTINPQHVIAHTLFSLKRERFSSNEYREELLALRTFASELSPHWYACIASGMPDARTLFLPGGWKQLYLKQFLSTIEQSLAFAPIRAQTEAYLHWCQEQWERNVAQTCEYICELTGFDLATSFTVYVTHPSLCNGSYLGEHNIQWGHHEDWPLYTTVYLWHEILHSYFCRGDLNHALIQLLTDNELRVRLNEGASYPPFVGHPRLFPLMHALLPDWRAYLAEAHKDIRQLEARLEAQKLVS